MKLDFMLLHNQTWISISECKIFKLLILCSQIEDKEENAVLIL